MEEPGLCKVADGFGSAAQWLGVMALRCVDLLQNHILDTERASLTQY